MVDLFESLFKVRPEVFSRGEFGFSPSWPVLTGGFILLLLAIVPLLRYARRGGGRVAWGPVALRLALLLLVLFCLARPVLTISTLIPQESYVGVLIDDSASMGIRDDGGSSRAEVLLSLLGGEGGLLSDLEERFKVRLFSIGERTERVEGLEEFTFLQPQSGLAEGILAAADELASVPLSGLVLLTDGADNGRDSMDDRLVDLTARSVRVHTVGFGEERLERDVEVSRIEAPTRVLQGSSLVVEVSVEQEGFEGEGVVLEVEDEGRIVSTQPLEFGAEGEPALARVSFTATEPGPREFDFRIAAQEGETVTENNRRGVLIEVEERTEKVLYFEGEPRDEVGFLRRAVQEDENLQLVVLLRAAENRFSRFGLDDPQELEGGFPTSREELFSYSGLILGSIEASYFTLDQLRMISDFVEIRGGGLMMIGGRRAFSEGGWAGTPVGEVLPVVLGPDATGEGEIRDVLFKVALTPAGEAHPALQLAETREGTMEAWERFREVGSPNPVTTLKPGATSLVEATGGELDEDQIVLAFQRYGRGRALAWTVANSWRWQMDAAIPLEDQSYENLWKQLLRWLVSYSPDAVALEATRETVAVGEAVDLVAEVRDDGYRELNHAQVLARVTSPQGLVQEVPLYWDVQFDGRYKGGFVASEEGRYAIDFEARSDGDLVGSGRSWVRAKPLQKEYFQPQMRRELLEHVAETTGGRFYGPREARGLADDLELLGGGSTRIETLELWDMPILLLLALTLLGGEWWLRRRRGVGLRVLAWSVVLAFLASPGWSSTCLLVVSGLSGGEGYPELFHEWSLDTLKAAEAGGLSKDNVIYLAEDPEVDPESVAGPSRSEGILAAIDRLTDRCGPDGELWLVFYGHGSARDGESRLNLPGPDLSQSDLASHLDGRAIGRTVIVIAGSSSSGFIEALSGPDRIVVTATRTVSQRHATTFGAAFSKGLGDPRADADKDDRVSLLEAFEFARLEVERGYESEGLMQVENALLEDGGDGTGSLEPSVDGEDGSVAALVFLAEPESSRAETPEMAALLERQEDLQGRVAELRRQRDSLDPELYLEELEGLLLELAQIDAQIRASRESQQGAPES